MDAPYGDGEREMATRKEIKAWFDTGACVVGMDDAGHNVGEIDNIDYDGDVYIGGRLFNPHEVSLYAAPSGNVERRAREIVGQLVALVYGLDEGGLDRGRSLDHATEILEGARRLLADIEAGT
jgi:hypothetical protein